MEQNITLTVTQLNNYIKLLLDSQDILHRVYVCGEISNFTAHRSGHFYFTLKDSDASIRAVVFRSNAQKLKFKPDDGMRVVVCGSISVFTRDGLYQLYVDTIEPDGIGSLYIAFEQVKHRLESEGLFDKTNKKALPSYPNKIGVITSPTGAAVRDIINVTSRRYPLADILIFPTAVQGNNASRQLTEAVSYFNLSQNVDVIIIGRGGGSIEDLWAFNDETLAREIAASKIPIISAVGHETDFTICDFVSDLRAPTPSAAAELSVPLADDIVQSMRAFEMRFDRLINDKLTACRKSLNACSDNRFFTESGTVVERHKNLLSQMSEGLKSAINSKLEYSRSVLKEKTIKIELLSPLAILSRGYSTVTNSAGVLIKSKDNVKNGQNIIVNFSDGQILAKVIKKGEFDGEKH